LCADLNNDTLNYTWYINSTLVENQYDSSMIFRSNDYDLGFHNVMVRVKDGDTTSASAWTIRILALPSHIPEVIDGDILKVYPNPFKQVLSIDFYLEKQAHVHISVLDIQSRLIGILSDQIQLAGQHSISWDFGEWNNMGKSGRIYILRAIFTYDNLTITQEKKIIKMD
jgi:hypothetical protein